MNAKPNPEPPDAPARAPLLLTIEDIEHTAVCLREAFASTPAEDAADKDVEFMFLKAADMLMFAAQALAREREARAQLDERILNIPNAIVSYSTPPMRMVTGERCTICGSYWLSKDDGSHPDNECVYYEAWKRLAALPAPAKGAAE